LEIRMSVPFSFVPEQRQRSDGVLVLVSRTHGVTVSSLTENEAEVMLKALAEYRGLSVPAGSCEKDSKTKMWQRMQRMENGSIRAVPAVRNEVGDEETGSERTTPGVDGEAPPG
jgi:hypothetical protein